MLQRLKRNGLCMLSKTVLTLSIMGSFVGSISESCTLQRPLISKPLEYKSDCSFSNAGNEDFGSGSPSYDLGDGIVYQLMRYAITDDYLANWVVSDCKKRQFSVVTPKIDTSVLTHCSLNYVLDEIDDPKSSIRVALETGGLENLERMAGEMGHRVGELDWVRSYGRNGFTTANKSILSRRVDPFCGCKIWYPEVNTSN